MKEVDFLKQRGFKVFHFWNNDVFNNTDGVMENIRLIILKLIDKKD
jgi:very-short-patch-repair endonuclease